MAISYKVPIDLNKNEILNFRSQNLSSAPSSPEEGLRYFDTTLHSERVYADGTWQTLRFSGEDVSSIVASGALNASASTGDVTLTIDAATGSVPGTMSAADKTKLDASTSSNTPSTIVSRDASGNFSAGTITASLTGTASNASQLGSHAGSYYLDRDNHTGSQLASTISNFDTQVRTSRLDQLAAPTTNLSLNSNKLINVADPTSAQDAATKAYVDSTSQGIDQHDPVTVATTGNITLSGLQTIDGYALSASDRVLVKDQSTASQNGIYIAASGAWSRAVDADSTGEIVTGTYVFVSNGEEQANSSWRVTTANPITIGSTGITFTLFSQAGEIEAGNGLTKTGSSLDVGAGTGITVNADSVQISSAYAGQASITTLGTVTTGTWSATTIAVNKGGTGITSYTPGNYINAASSSSLQQRTPSQVRSDIGAVEANTAITGATHTKITYDSKGLVTSGASLDAGDIPSLAASKITSGTFDIGLLPTVDVAHGGTGLTTIPSNEYVKGAGTGNVVTRTYGEVKTDLGLNNVENVALSTWAGSANITTLGTISSGTWGGSTIPLNKGGTGATTASAARSALSAAGKYASSIGNGSLTEFTVTHNLNSRDVVVGIVESASPYAVVYADVVADTVNTVKVSFSDPPSSNQYRVVVTG